MNAGYATKQSGLLILLKQTSGKHLIPDYLSSPAISFFETQIALPPFIFVLLQDAVEAARNDDNPFSVMVQQSFQLLIF